MTIKYSILMPYINRAGHLHNTLVSFKHHYADRDDYEVMLVEDIKNPENDHKRLLDVISAFGNDIHINLIVAGKHEWFNPSPLFNIAAKSARGSYFIITSPEIFHKSNVLDALDTEFTKDPDAYIVCACENRKGCNLDIKAFDDLGGVHDVWYQHSMNPCHNEGANRMYHFCTAISKDNYFKLGGFDEDYSFGICYDDNDLIDRVQLSGIPVVVRDDMVTVHIAHKHDTRPDNWRELFTRNQQIYKNKVAIRANHRMCV